MKQILLVILILTTSNCFAQSTAGETSPYETRNIVDMPTAGVLPKGHFGENVTVFTGGGVLLELSAAPFEDFNFGISISCMNLIGDGDLAVQKIPGVSLRWRFINETALFPAVATGFSTQGRGDYYKSDERFHTLSPGLYLSASKSFRWLIGSLALHAGVNYSFEQIPEQRSLNLFFGLEQSLGKSAALNIEMNPTFDDENKTYILDKGLLNASVRWSVMKGVTIELIFRDLLNHLNNSPGFERWLGVEFIHSI